MTGRMGGLRAYCGGRGLGRKKAGRRSVIAALAAYLSYELRG